MKLINKEGMVFGKINIIDLLIVVFIVAVVAVGGIKLTEDKGVTYVSQTSDYEMKILLKSIYHSFPEMLVEGDQIYDDATGELIGELTVNDTEPATQPVETSDGDIVNSVVPNRYDITLTIDGSGVYNQETGLQAAGDTRYIGESIKIRTDDFLVEGVIVDLQVEGE